ncbi:ribosome silencing factor [Macrococcus hajekii]|uniref:Ribosomal silencing factor RsfS n=1 Tax=Macrococcus hajekii TaxID=198482 RepID=A0A4R6BM20_9STAP|nr:ribosome silencing factor [Macrococcus hajekii]TDM02859.1 ribosome silencing factor [Macrococcus hajekii]GGB04454.1 ribosomal silencing factor RsfS [Macrococcus hajekii]
MDSKQLLELAFKACDDKKAEEIIGIDVKEISGITDYYVICHANSDRQVQAIAREVKEQAEEVGIEVGKLEGFNEAQWILVDLDDVVVHIFHREERGYYNLERLYRDAEFITYEQ